MDTEFRRFLSEFWIVNSYNKNLLFWRLHAIVHKTNKLAKKLFRRATSVKCTVQYEVCTIEWFIVFQIKIAYQISMPCPLIYLKNLKAKRFFNGKKFVTKLDTENLLLFSPVKHYFTLLTTINQCAPAARAVAEEGEIFNWWKQ